MRFVALLLPLLAGACASGGGYPALSPRPAETPRALPSPGVAVPAVLSPGERQGLLAGLERERRALATTVAAVDREGLALDRLLQKPQRDVPGSPAWGDAQRQLSRLDAARMPFDELRACLSPLLLLVDGLGDEDPDRVAVYGMVAEVEHAAAAARSRVGKALAVLGGGQGDS